MFSSVLKMKCFSLLFLLFLSSGTRASVAPAPPACGADGNQPDTDDCAGYYECQGGVATKRQCPFGLFFNYGKKSKIYIKDIFFIGKGQLFI